MVNIVIRELLPYCNGSIKIGVMVEEYWPAWAIVLTSLGYQVLKNCVSARFRKFLQGDTLSGAEWLPPNQARSLSNLQNSWSFVSGSPSFVRKLWGGGIKMDRTAVFMSVGYIVRKFRVIHVSKQIVHHRRVEGGTIAKEWLRLGVVFGNPSMEFILSFGVPKMLNTIWYKMSKLKTTGEDVSTELSMKDGNRDKENVSTGGLFPHKNSLCFIEGPSVFTRSMQTSR